MKDIWIILVVVVVILGFVACGPSKEEEPAQSNQPGAMHIWHDDLRGNTCYLYSSYGLSCVADHR